MAFMNKYMANKRGVLTKRSILKNVVVLNLSFVLSYAAGNCVNSIQSIVNQSQSMGTISQSISFASNILTSLVIPQFICDLIGFKLTLALGELFNLCFVVVQIYPTWFTLAPTSILSGLGNSICWCIYGVYLTMCSKMYAKVTNTSFERVQTFIFGLSTAIFFFSGVLSQTLVAVVLQTETPDNNLTTTISPVVLDALNQSSTATVLRDYFKTNVDEDFDFANSCGRGNCPSTELPKSLAKTTETSFFIFYVLLVVIGLSACLVTVFFLDNLTQKDLEVDNDVELKAKENESKEEENEKVTLSLLKTRFKDELSSLFQLYSIPDVWLLFPVTVYATFELTFLWNEFNRAFAVCLLGFNYVGWTNIFQGLLSSALTLIMGYVLKYIGFKAGIIFMLAVSAGTDVFIISWTPDPTQVASVFLLIAAFSLSQCVSRAQVIGLYGIYFPENKSAYSAWSLAATFGLLTGSLASSYLCVDVKTLIHLVMIFLSFVGFVALEIKKEKKRLSDDSEQK